MALSKQSPGQFPGQHRNRHEGQLYPLSPTGLAGVGQPRKLMGSLLTSLQADVVQILALDARYLLRIRTSQQAFKTYLECFTRRGQLMGQLAFNVPIAQISLTAVPYQLIARTANSGLILISLKPFQVQQLPDYGEVLQVSALDWGYWVSCRQYSLVLDKLGHLVSRVEGLPPAEAIASMGDRQILLATPSATGSSAKSPLADIQSTNGPSSLYIVDLKNLDLGIIF
jgi:hypothetical protein